MVGMEQVLPDDLVADVLARLPPRSLAAARCVCRRWSSVVDLLLRHLLLPLRLDGIFCNSHGDDQHNPYPYFLASPLTARRIAGHLHPLYQYDDGARAPDRRILDHCNGLLLLGWDVAVVNPATRRWAPLPRFPQPRLPPLHEFDRDLYPCLYLVYDPSHSQHHFQVFLIPDLMLSYEHEFPPNQAQSEWPPSPYTTHVFSSTTWKWEVRSFVRQGEATGTVANVKHSPFRRRRHGVYFQGALYVLCQDDSVMRVSLSSDNKYQMIKSPLAGSTLDEFDAFYLGKSEKGVYSALLDQDETGWPHFRVWLLNDHQMEWELRSDVSLRAMAGYSHILDLAGYSHILDFDNRHNKPWILANYCYEIIHDGRSAPQAAQEDEFDNEFGFDNGGTILQIKDNDAFWYLGRRVLFLGFHPYKEVALFISNTSVLSYQLKTSEVRELGVLHVPLGMEMYSFLYTPCWMHVEHLFSRFMPCLKQRNVKYRNKRRHRNGRSRK